MPELLYLDSSALVKLVLVEPESSALADELESWAQPVSSVIAEVEVHRAALRSSQPPGRADALLQRLWLLMLDGPRRRHAQRVGSPLLRALDAIHLASALSLGDDLDAFCCYDRRLIADAEAAGLNVLSPGLD